MQWEVDEESIYSLRNWFTEFNLECQPGTVIGTFGSIFFSGDLASTVISAPIIDYYGRKRAFWDSRLIMISVFLVMGSLPSDYEHILPVMFMLLFLFGLTQTM